MIVLTEIGLLHQKQGNKTGDDRSERHHRQALILLFEGEQPGDRHDVERLQELGWLELREADAKPPPRPVHLDADDRHEEEQAGEEQGAQQAQPPRGGAGSIDTATITGRASTIHIICR
jgi:hypothetical protein